MLCGKFDVQSYAGHSLHTSARACISLIVLGSNNKISTSPQRGRVISGQLSMSRCRNDMEARVCLQGAHIRWGWPDIGMTSESAAFSLSYCQTNAHTGRCV